jgi:hypothetical protein
MLTKKHLAAALRLVKLNLATRGYVPCPKRLKVNRRAVYGYNSSYEAGCDQRHARRCVTFWYAPMRGTP